MVDWLAVMGDPIDAVEHGVRQGHGIDSVQVGPRTWDRIDYPVGEVMPQSFRHVDGNDYESTINANCYYEVGRDVKLVDDILHSVADVVSEVNAALDGTQNVYHYRVDGFDAYAGEMDDTLIAMFMLEFAVGTQADLSTT